MELFDAVDREENKLGFDLIRGENIPDGVYHRIVEIFTINERMEILLTKRDFEKMWGGLWEITGGAVIKGETPEEGALRELQEETGLQVKKEDLHRIALTCNKGDPHGIYHTYAVFVEMTKQHIRLQAGETIDYRFVSYEEFLKMVESDQYVPSLGGRFVLYRKRVEQYMMKLLERKNASQRDKDIESNINNV